MSSTRDDVTTPAPPRLEEVSEGVFAYIQPDGTWWINNAGFLAGRRGVLSIDTCSTVKRTRAYQAAIASVTAQPVRTVLNTHHHGDHTFGNHLFAGATIIGHDQTREAAIQWGKPWSAPLWTEVEWGEFVLEPPFVTYSEGITLWCDDLRAQARYVGLPAHTTNDSIVWLPDRQVLFCGDLLFNGGTPFLVQGSVEGAIQVLENVVRPLGAQTIVPGHGNPAGPELIDEVLGYLRFVQATARAGRAAGLTPLEVARQTDLGRYAALTDSERIVGNLHRAYAELDGAALGAPINAVAALTDMVAFNGGNPLTCKA